MRLRVGNAPDITANFTSEMLFRFFKEQSLSQLDFDAWRNGQCICILTPEQIAYSNSALSESLSRQTNLDIDVTFKESRQYRIARDKYDETDFYKSANTRNRFDVKHADAYINPKFEMRVMFRYENHTMTLGINAESYISKNQRAYTGGPSGLDRTAKLMPQQGGLRRKGTGMSYGGV